MEYLRIAESLNGLKEIKGPQDNPKIMGMYAALGHDWVEHDEVPWCAAFVGFCLEEGGIRSTRKLNARSYEKFGSLVYKKGVKGSIDNALKGDICVYSRGNSSWQGHVNFFIRQTKNSIYGLGGNQMNEVNVKPYSKSKLICIVRPSAGTKPPQLLRVQERLKELGYHEVGNPDGIMGTRTKGAILAFREDHGLPLIPVSDAQMEALLFSEDATPRYIAPERAHGTPKGSRILSDANTGLAVSVAGAAGSVAAGVGKAEEATDTAARAINLFGLGDAIAPYWPWITGAIFVIIIIIAFKIRGSRIEDYREGKTP